MAKEFLRKLEFVHLGLFFGQLAFLVFLKKWEGGAKVAIGKGDGGCKGCEGRCKGDFKGVLKETYYFQTFFASPLLSWHPTSLSP